MIDSMSEIPAHTCTRGGWLVSAERWLPADPYDWHWGAGRPEIGCNHLVCRSCETDVRQRPGFAAKPNDDAVSAAAVHGAADHDLAWEAVPGIVRDPGARLYACSCQVRTERTSRPTLPEQVDVVFGFHSSWRCAGHPMPPRDFDGVTLDAAADLGAIAAASFRDARPPTPPWGALWAHAKYPGFWAARCYALMPAGRRDDLARAVAPLLTSAEARERRGAIDFYLTHSIAPGAERLTEALRDHAALFAGVPDPGSKRRDLAWFLQEAFERRLKVTDEAGAPIDRAAVALARQQVVRADRSRTVIHALAHVDAPWIAANVDAIFEAQPAKLKTVMMALAHAPEDVAFDAVMRLAGRDDVDAGAVEAALPSLQRSALAERIRAALP